MKFSPLFRRALVLPVALAPAWAADVVKLNNNTALNAGGAWTGGGVPTTTDVALWNNTFTAVASGSLSPLGGDLSFQGLKVTNPAGTANSTNLVGFTNASSANTLTLGSAGIDMSAATQALLIQSKLALSANQTWNIANANTATAAGGLNVGEDLIVAAQAAATMNLGGFTLTKTGAGVAAISSGYTISNGTINVNGGTFHFQSGGSRLSTIASSVNINVNSGGTLALAVQSAAVSVQSPITLNTGGTINLIPGQANALTISSNINAAGNGTLAVVPQVNNAQNAGATLLFSGNLTGAGNITYQNTLSTVVNRLRMSGDNSGYSGTLTMATASGASRFLRLQSATAGSAAATWNLTAGNTLEIDGVSVQLGTLNGAGILANSHASNPATATVGAGTFSGTIVDGTAPGLGLIKTGTGTLTMSGANTYTGATQVNLGTLLTSPAQTGATSVTVADGASFGVVVSTAGTTFSANSLTAGTTTGSTVILNTGLTGNPTAPVLSATTFTPSAGTVVQVPSTELSVANNIPLISYGTMNGAGFGGLTLSLPARTVGSLVNNTGASRVDLNITAVEQVKWTGATNGVWDADTTGGGVLGTANWKTTVTNAATRYLQGSGGTDTANFDDSATGTHNVTLSTTLTPLNVKVSGTSDYTFAGSGKLSGSMILAKSGTGTLTIANTTANDYTGGTTIAAGGKIVLGDGVTAGAGVIAGSIANEGTLALNRPDDFTFTNTLTGAGTLQKMAANTVTISSVFNPTGNVQIDAGKLTTTAGGTVSTVLSGAGQFQSGGGTLQLTGAVPNTNTGATNVTAGLLQLNKPAGVDAVGGDINISGGGQLALLAGEQIPNGATINFTGTSADSIPTQAAQETVAAVTVNSATPGASGGQLIMRSNFTVTGTATVNSGILGVASGNTGNVNTINITSAPGSNGIVRIAGGSGASVLNVGAGGITASGGEIQVKFSTAAQDATLNLGGDFTATGNVAITNGGFTGANLNVINLVGDRRFDIASGTTTTSAADFGGTGAMTKAGAGTLSLLTSSTGGWTGATVVEAGTLALAGGATLPNTPSITVKSGAILDVSALSSSFTVGASQTVGGKGTINGTVTTAVGAKIAPGESPGTLTFANDLNLTNAVSATGSASLLFELDSPLTSDQIVLTTGTLTIGAGGLEFDDFAFTALGGFGPGTYLLVDTTLPINGTLGTNLTGTIGGRTATLGFADGTNDLALTVVPEPGLLALAAGSLALTFRHRRKNA